MSDEQPKDVQKEPVVPEVLEKAEGEALEGEAEAPPAVKGRGEAVAATEGVPKKPKKLEIKLSRADMERIWLAREDVDFVKDSRAALLSKSTPMANAILYFLVIFILVGLIWSYFSKLDEVTRGMGKVIPSSHVQIIQNLEGGILSQIFVKEGDIVKKGQVLAQLDNTLFSAQYREGYSKYLSLQASIARLRAETLGKEEIAFPDIVQQDHRLMDREKELFQSRKETLKNALKNLQHSYDLATHEQKITEPLVKEGVVSKIELLRLRREVASLKNRLDAYRDAVQEKALTQFTETKAESDMLSEKLTALKDRMNRTAIRSPANGVVKQIYIETLGGIIRPGEPIMEVVPMDENLIIEAKVRPRDIAFIKVGQKATARITAYDSAIYGSLPAKVTHISADTSIDKMGNSFYQVDLKTEKNYLGTKPGSLPIKPGMMAIVDIKTGKKSMLTYLLKPILRAKQKALRER